MAQLRTDRAKLLIKKQQEAEARYALTKNPNDLTEVIRASREAKEAVITSTPDTPVERKGAPLGNRWP